ncbi:MAG: OmpA family protein [Flavobacterium sp.]
MNKIILFIAIISFKTLFAQEITDTKDKNLYNRWSIEVNAGQNKPVRPFAFGYYSTDPSKYFNFSGVNHYDVGVRYMLSSAFGLKVDYSMDQFSEQSGAGSLLFDTKLNRFGLQGVMNLGRLLRFESFTNRIGIVAHAGLQVSQFSVNEGTNKNVTEDNGGIMFGITPQIRLTKWMALTADFTAINNVRQHLNWDGSKASSEENLSGVLYNTSVGLTFYLGKKDQHADWYTKEDALSKLPTIDEEARKRLDKMETLMNDTDRDGVVDHLDAENNTPSGVVVDTKGRFIDTNKNGTPDEMEPKVDKELATTQIKNVISTENELVESGLTNIFFGVNSDIPNAESSNNLYIILHYMQNNPLAKVTILGFADKRGSEEMNQDLSTRRAQKVGAFLVANTIATSRIKIEGNGTDTKFADGSITNLNLARRVSLQIEK